MRDTAGASAVTHAQRLGSGASIVVVTHNSAHQLGRMLSALIESGAEVIVVDNASRDDTVLVAQNAGARVVEIRTNAGYAAACNRGIDAAGPAAEWMGFVNPDVKLSADDVRRLLDSVPDEVWAVSPLTLTPQGGPQPDVARPAPTAAFVAAMYLGLSRSRPPAAEIVNAAGGRYLFADVLSGGSMFVRRRAFDAIGRWDEAFFFNCEDIDLCIRIAKAGGRVAVDRSVRAAHNKEHSSSTVDTEGRRLECARAYVTYFQLHGSRWQAASVAACAFVGCALRRAVESVRRTPAPRRGARAYARLFSVMWTSVAQAFHGAPPDRPATDEFLDA